MAYTVSSYKKYSIKIVASYGQNDTTTRTVSGLNFATSGVSGSGLVLFTNAPIFFNRLWSISQYTPQSYSLVTDQAYEGSES